MGVQFFGGKFFKCVDDEGELLPIDVSAICLKVYVRNTVKPILCLDR